MKRHTFHLSVAFFTAMIMCCSQQLAARELQITSDCARHETINFVLSNPNKTEIVVPAKSLPWAIGTSSMRYDGFIVNNGKAITLKREYILADYFTTQTISGGAKATGLLNLNSLFRNLSSLRSEGDIIIYWRFDSNRLISPLSSWRTTESGIILLPRKGLFNTPCGGVIYNGEFPVTQK